MARALEGDEPAAGRPSERRAPGERVECVLVAVQDEHRAANPSADVAEALAAAELERLVALDQCLGRDLEAPADGVLDLLRRVRLGEHSPEEELEELLVVLEPVVAVVLRPPVLGVEAIFEGVDVPFRVTRREWHRGADEHAAQDPIRVVRGEQCAPERTAGEPDEDRRLRPGRVHDR